MKTRSAETLRELLTVLSIFLLMGCNDRQASSSQSSSTQLAFAVEEAALKELGAKVGMTFSTNAVLLKSTDGGRRDSSHGFYAWGLFSPQKITMPSMKAPGVSSYLDLPLEDTVKFVQGMMGNRSIFEPQAAFISEWETNGYAFRGTLVRAAQGDYLAIERFRKR